MFVDLLTRVAAAARTCIRASAVTGVAAALAVMGATGASGVALGQTTITVSTTADDGPGSLRQAIVDTNAGTGGTINFAIPDTDPGFDAPGTPGAWRIALAAPLPPISRPTVVNGLSQPGSSCAAPKIEIRPAAGAMFTGDGLAVVANDCQIRGLVINGFIDSGISLTGTTGCVVSCNFIGTDVTGTALLGNGTGLVITNGVSNVVGGTDPNTGNLIAGSAGIGVSVVTTGVPSNVGNAIVGNSIRDNGALGIDLGANGVTDNDDLDLDIGPNHFQNYPVINSFDGGVISATLNSLPNRRFRVEFFANTGQDPTGFGEGSRFIASLEVTTGVGGAAAMMLPYSPGPEVRYVTATATALPPLRSGQYGETGPEAPITLRGIAPAAPTGTSEFSRAFFVGAGGGNTPPVAESFTVTTPEDTDATITLVATDADGQALTLRIASLPALGQLLQFGTLTPIAAAGTVVTDAQRRVVYRPPANVNGSPLDTFTYFANDGEADSNIATVTVNVTPVNDPPAAADDAYATNEDTPLTVGSVAAGMLGNDSDPDVPPQMLTAVLVSTTTHGSLTFNTNGTFTYSPQPNYNGTDSFTYRASDGTAQSNIATATISIAPVNDPPVARNDSYLTNEDVALTVPPPGVLLNDSDVDNDVSTLAVTVVAQPSNGSLSNVAAGGFRYTPNANYNGTDSFTYRLNDGQAQSNTATVSIIIQPVNDPPIAADDTYATDEDTNLVVTTRAAGVLGNDTDPEGAVLSATVVTMPTHGVLLLASDGTFSYVPAPNFNGMDSFTYMASDGLANSNTATARITVRPINDAPFAVDDQYTTNEDTVLTISTRPTGVLRNDIDAEGDPLTAVLMMNADHGSVVLAADGTFVYTPDSGFHGLDSFTYRANDGQFDSNVGTVRVDVLAVNDAPIAVDDAYSTDENAPLTVNTVAAGVLGNDTDPDGDTLTSVLVSDVSHGTLVLNADGTFTYSPVTNYNGTDSFSYRARDAALDSNIATVEISIRGVNDPPVAVDDAYATSEDTPLTVSTVAAGVLGNDSDPDVPPQPLSAVLVSTTTHGSLTFNIDGTFTYSPQPNYNGPDSFTYRASDGTAQSNVATATITIAPVNDPPVARNDSYLTSEDVALTVPAPGVLLNDSDIDNDLNTLIVTIVAQPAHGALSNVAAGGFTYTPNPNYNGTDTFTYRLNDGQAQSNTATVSIIVQPVNDPPVAVDDAYATDVNTPLNIPAPGVLANDTDLDSPSLTAIPASGASHGVVVLNADGSFLYTPAPDYTGPDSFTYAASDGAASSNTAIVAINVGGGGNLPPVARCRDVIIDARASCPPDFFITPADVNNGSSDPDDPTDSLTFTLSNSGPFPIGATGVTLTVTDPHGASSSCQATVTVLGNDCNGNGVPDTCDIAIGGSADCNRDGIPDECQCIWDSGMATPNSGGRYSQLGGRAQVAAKVADDFYIEPGQVCHITSFTGQMQTNLAPTLRRARLEFYEDCDGAPRRTPFATFANSVVNAVEPGADGHSLVTYSFDLCEANLWLDGGKTYWVSLFALAGCADSSESFWAAAAGPMQCSTPRVALGRPSPYLCTNVTFDPWLPADTCCGHCQNMAFKIGGACCPIIWDNGPYWHCPGGGGLPSGRNGAFQARSADNFMVMPCNDQTVCFIEATIWTDCNPNTGFVEIYANDCKRPAARLFSAPVSQAIPTGETIRVGTIDVHAYLLRFYDLNWVLPAGGTYWLSAGATGAGGSINQRSYFAIADTCGTRCDIHISPAWMGNVGLGGAVMWCPKTEDLSFRIGARPGVIGPAGAAPVAVCPSDMNGDGDVGVQDLLEFMTDWFAGCP